MMPSMDDYRKGWALRCLREARAELLAANKNPYMSSDLVLDAMKKAQAAIYYSLGEPVFIEAIVRQHIGENKHVADPVLRFLVETERAIQQAAQTTDKDREGAVQLAGNLIQMASDVVVLITGVKA